MNPLLPLILAAALIAGCAPLAQQTRPEPAAAQSQADAEKAEAEDQAKALAKLPNVELTTKLLYGLASAFA